MRIETRLKLGFVVAALLMAGSAAIPFYTGWTTDALQTQLLQAQERVETLGSVLSLLKDTETGERGFTITGNEVFLEPYHEGLVRLKPVREQLQALRAESPAYPPMLDRLDTLVQLRLDQLERVIALRREKGLAAAATEVASGKGKRYMDGIRAVVAELARQEAVRRSGLQHRVDRRTSIDIYAGLGVTVLNASLIGLLLFSLFRVLRERQRTAAELRATTDSLHRSLAEQAQRRTELELIGQMARALESTDAPEEIFHTIAIHCVKLLPATAGTVYMFRNSRDMLVKESDWGEPAASLEAMPPADCWALRRGQMHCVAGPHDLLCPHWRDAGRVVEGAVCMPLVAQGEVMGLLCLEPRPAGQHPDPLGAAQRALILAASEQIALTLSNVRLREVLRQQSVVDPLTGLYNRRYMDETLRRELARAVRKQLPLSVMVLDVDHFKRINDMFGHEGGDMVLRAVAQQLRDAVRESDVACRLGGEEFVLILPECTKQAAGSRADGMAHGLRALQLQYVGQQIGRVTASFGVATFPADGQDGPALVKAADRAMYSAKTAGRDRVMLAAA